MGDLFAPRGTAALATTTAAPLAWSTPPNTASAWQSHIAAHATAAAATAAAASAAAPSPAAGAGGSEAADAELRACLLELRAVAKGTLSFLTDSEEEAAAGVLEQAVLPDQMELEAEGGGGGGGGGGEPNPNSNP